MRGDGDQKSGAGGQSRDRTSQQSAKWGGQGAHSMFLVGDDRGFGLALITRADGHRPGGDLRVGSNLSAHRGPTRGAQGGAEYVAAHARSTQHEVNTCIQQPTSAHPRPLCGPDDSAHNPPARARGARSPVERGDPATGSPVHGHPPNAVISS